MSHLDWTKYRLSEQRTPCCPVEGNASVPLTDPSLSHNLAGRNHQHWSETFYLIFSHKKPTILWDVGLLWMLSECRNHWEASTRHWLRPIDMRRKGWRVVRQSFWEGLPENRRFHAVDGESFCSFQFLSHFCYNILISKDEENWLFFLSKRALSDRLSTSFQNYTCPASL